MGKAPTPQQQLFAHFLQNLEIKAFSYRECHEVYISKPERMLSHYLQWKSHFLFLYRFFTTIITFFFQPHMLLNWMVFGWGVLVLVGFQTTFIVLKTISLASLKTVNLYLHTLLWPVLKIFIHYLS